MIITFGAPGVARTGCGQAGDDWSVVRPMTPGNAVPGLYSISPIGAPPAAWDGVPVPPAETRTSQQTPPRGPGASPAQSDASLRPARGPVPVAVEPALGDVLHHPVRDQVPDRLARVDPLTALGGRDGQGRDLDEADLVTRQPGAGQLVSGAGAAHEVGQLEQARRVLPGHHHGQCVRAGDEEELRLLAADRPKLAQRVDGV